eukprot:GHVP01036584.1.p1 GENE.GHVP01036584.1~~GHVP01036584.1.p1  ORF type:complete len:105 (-),score=8.45 GHVP01036584.1:15-329(-)
MPFRVLSVHSEGKAAWCRNLLSSQIREVHLQNARFITPPKSFAQKLDWKRTALADPAVQVDSFSNFWNRIEEPDTDQLRTQTSNSLFLTSNSLFDLTSILSFLT